jgi:3-deoxy-D-manno-octulosonic-acid transferase
MKFDAGDYADERIADYADQRIGLGLKDKEKLLVAGSTHPGEEEIVLDVYKELLAEFPYLRLLIAPRHPERATEIEKMIIRYGFRPLRVAQIDQRPTSPQNVASPPRLFGGNQPSVFILDTVGHLVDYYAVADLVFVGGSLIRKGGHNILEPAALGKPILFGPYMFNFRDISELFLENQAAQSVRNRDELAKKSRDLLNDSSKALQFSRRAKGLIRENQGATQKNLGLIKNLYAKTSL